jgi:hypothetical protein
MKLHLFAAVAAITITPVYAADCNSELDQQVALTKQHIQHILVGSEMDKSLRGKNLSYASDDLLNKIVEFFDLLISEDNMLIESANNLHQVCNGPVMPPTGMGIAAMAEDRDLAQAELRRRR